MDLSADEMNALLGRTEMAVQMEQLLCQFEKQKRDLQQRRGIYIYGAPGIGKTTFVSQLLQKCGYDVVRYDAGDVRNAGVFKDLTRNTIPDKSVVSTMFSQPRPLAILMDEIDGMTGNDKGGVASLIRLIRPKKTKKQHAEDSSMVPILCIGNYRMDKKIKELMKVCHTFELPTPTTDQIVALVRHVQRSDCDGGQFASDVAAYVSGDLKKLNDLLSMYRESPDTCRAGMATLFALKSGNEDTKRITQRLFTEYFPLHKHMHYLGETDRTSIGLLWHENLPDALAGDPLPVQVDRYLEQLNNICFSDYIDRITFQKQIWQFNEMSSLMKNMWNNKLYHERQTIQPPPLSISTGTAEDRIRFTKVLTRYATEYNNSQFILRMTQQLDMDRRDMFHFFAQLYGATNEHLEHIYDTYGITKLDVSRMSRYIEKYWNDTLVGVIGSDGDCDGDINDDNTIPIGDN